MIVWALGAQAPSVRVAAVYGSAINKASICRWVIALASISALVFAGVAFTEVRYIRDHPYAYGPAKVIAYAGGAGAVLSVAVAMLARAVGFAEREATQRGE